MGEATDPRATRVKQEQQRLLAIYDKWMVHPLHAAFFGNSDFYNYGYSEAPGLTQAQACEALVEKLLSFLPHKSGTILDVACGLGASTRLLLKYYAPQDVTAINISERQLERARQNAPGARFLRMDAVQLEFSDASFDAVLCVESAFHFTTREQFLREACRVLKPGGTLVLSDILGWVSRSKRANVVKSPAAYAALLARAGFEDVQVLDATEAATRTCARRLSRWPGVELRAGRLSFTKFARAWLGAQAYALFMRWTQPYYVVAAARKPA